MNFLEKLEKEMEIKNIKNLHDLSVRSNIPYSTLRGFYTKGFDKIKLSTLIKLKDYFGCTLDYLCDDSVIESDQHFPPKLSKLEANQEEK